MLRFSRLTFVGLLPFSLSFVCFVAFFIGQGTVIGPTPLDAWVGCDRCVMRRLAARRDTLHAASTHEVKGLSREARDLKEVVAEHTLGFRLPKKCMFDVEGDHE